MPKAKIILDREFTLDQVDGRLFGSFVEHVGRAVYGGIYEPGHPTADPEGMRGDVLALTRELGISVVRYPGGNFVSGFDWRDAIGPRAQRPTRPSLAWSTLESNQVGLHEFAHWAGAAGCQMMYAVNLGTRGLEDARDLVEYANLPGGSYYSDLRRKNGAERPFDIRLWCLGNEMDAPWQMGQKTPAQYGLLANETAKIMKMVDPAIQVAACGSSSPLPQFGRWEAEVLEQCYDNVDYLSLHRYHAKAPGMTTAEYLAQVADMDRYIRQTIALCDGVGAKRRSAKRLMLSFDEWNVWYHSKEADRELVEKGGRWGRALPLLEEIYTFEDALMVGGMLMTLMRHADRIKIACMAQLVNVLAPIMTQDGGPAWRQSIYWPFFHLSRYGRGTVLMQAGKSDLVDGGGYGAIPALDALAVLDGDGALTLFAINRAAQPLQLEMDLRGFGHMAVVEHIRMTADHMDDVNDRQTPNRVSPRRVPVEGDTCALLQPMSWNVLRIQEKGKVRRA